MNQPDDTDSKDKRRPVTKATMDQPQEEFISPEPDQPVERDSPPASEKIPREKSKE